MIKKQLYTIESTLKSNMLINYRRLIFNGQRNEIYNKQRDDNLTYIHLQTENFDKYYNTKFVGLYLFEPIESLKSFSFNPNEYYDEDYYDED